MLSYIDDNYNKMNYQQQQQQHHHQQQQHQFPKQHVSPQFGNNNNRHQLGNGHLQYQSSYSLSPQGANIDSNGRLNNYHGKMDSTNKSSPPNASSAHHHQQQQHSSTKNLSHVPCKFFKQGTCQAGNSCPFSHSLDSTLDTTPCKYFQKGNCKFGVKCALAHILPDGRRVNPKSLAQAYQQAAVVQQQQQQYHHNNNSSSTSSSAGQSSFSNTFHNTNNRNGSVTRSFSFNNSIQPISIASQQQQQQQYHQASTPSSSVNTTNSDFLLGSQNNSYQNNGNYTNYYNTAANISATAPTASMLSPTQQNSYITSNQMKNSIWNNQPLPQQQQQQSFLANQQRTLSTPQTGNTSSTTFVRPSFMSYDSNPQLQGSAILDDDDEVDPQKEEDFVPSSLSDLLTPQELQRRNSRPGSNSGGVSGQFLMLDPFHQEKKLGHGSFSGGVPSQSQQLILEEQGEDTQFLMD